MEISNLCQQINLPTAEQPQWIWQRFEVNSVSYDKKFDLEARNPENGSFQRSCSTLNFKDQFDHPFEYEENNGIGEEPFQRILLKRELNLQTNGEKSNNLEERTKSPRFFKSQTSPRDKILKNRKVICPVCGCKVTSKTFNEHYKLDLISLDENKANRNKSDLILTRTKTKKNKTEKEEELSGHELLDKVRKKRDHRSAQQITAQTNNSTDQFEEQAKVCFLCGEELHGDEEDINYHIDNCLHSTNNQSSQNSKNSRNSEYSDEEQEGEIETYSWGGQTRIRTCSLLEGGYAAINGLISKNTSKDEEGDLDITEDDEKFGKAQYTEADLVMFNDEQEEEDETLDEKIQNSKQSKIKEVNQKSSTILNTYNNSGGNLEILVESLKTRIKEQEKILNSSNKCLICLSTYNTPLVSINCWHVHCESCWLSSLGAKKLCPQCKVITAPTDLRRIYV